MTTNYTRGRAFEYRVREDLHGRGYLVIRSAGSHSPIDLLAGRLGHGIGVQVKRDHRFSAQDIQHLGIACEELGIKPVRAWREKRGRRWWVVYHGDV